MKLLKYSFAAWTIFLIISIVTQYKRIPTYEEAGIIVLPDFGQGIALCNEKGPKKPTIIKGTKQWTDKYAYYIINEGYHNDIKVIYLVAKAHDICPKFKKRKQP